MTGPGRAHQLLGGVAFIAALVLVAPYAAGILLAYWAEALLLLWAVSATAALLRARGRNRSLLAQYRHLLRRDQPAADPAPNVPALRFGPPDQRIGDADRDAVLERLRDRYASGHLTATELDERMSAAMNAAVRSDLAKLLHDLP